MNKPVLPVGPRCACGHRSEDHGDGTPLPYLQQPSESQLAGLTCLVCDGGNGPMVPVGFYEGVQVFMHSDPRYCHEFVKSLVKSLYGLIA